MRKFLFVVIASGCHARDGTDGGSVTTTGQTGGTGGFCDVRAVLQDECVVCHSAAGGLQGELDLESDPVAALVSQPSAAWPGRTLVVPGDPDGSFLLLKVSGGQGADGDPMPVPSGLDAARVEVIRGWIADGATASCAGPTPTGTGRFHPDGWATPSEHGTAAKFQQLDCLACHGADLAGGSSAVSCDGCHAADWRTTCTYCHGGIDDPTGAPPENIDDSTAAGDLASFPAHTVHVEETNHPAYGCEDCHAKPADPLTPGHLFVDDDTPGQAEVAIRGAGTWSAGTCANFYCHGDGQGPNGTADASFVATCDGCHPDGSSSEGRIEGMSGEHHLHVWDEGFDCSECHRQTVDAGHQIVDPTVHVDGRPQVDPAQVDWNAGNRTCQGICHGGFHLGNEWN